MASLGDPGQGLRAELRVLKKGHGQVPVRLERECSRYRMLIATTELIGRTARARHPDRRRSRRSTLSSRACARPQVDWPSRRRSGDRQGAAAGQARDDQAEASTMWWRGSPDPTAANSSWRAAPARRSPRLFVTEKLKAQRTLVLLSSLSLLQPDPQRMDSQLHRLRLTAGLFRRVRGRRRRRRNRPYRRSWCSGHHRPGRDRQLPAPAPHLGGVLHLPVLSADRGRHSSSTGFRLRPGVADEAHRDAGPVFDPTSPPCSSHAIPVGAVVHDGHPEILHRAA